MKGSKFLAIVVCLVLVACDEDPARKVKVIARPGMPGVSAVPSTPALQAVTAPPDDPSLGDPKRLLEFCPSTAETSSAAGLFMTVGSCAFQQREPVICNSLQDDFLVAFTRRAEHDANLVVYLNVEFYHGPGSYDHVEMFETLQSGENIYRWSNDRARATVGPGETFLTVPETELEAEPMLMNCTNTLGPATNYQFQCGRRGPAMLASVTFSGKLQCAPRSKSAKN